MTKKTRKQIVFSVFREGKKIGVTTPKDINIYELKGFLESYITLLDQDIFLTLNPQTTSKDTEKPVYYG